MRRIGIAAAAAAPEDVAEDITEDIAEATGSGAAETAAAKSAGLAVDAGMTELVVGRALLIVGEHFVGIGNLSEFLRCLLIFRIAIRMVLLRQPTIGFLDVLAVGALVDAQYFVVVTLGHY